MPERVEVKVETVLGAVSGFFSIQSKQLRVCSLQMSVCFFGTKLFINEPFPFQKSYGGRFLLHYVMIADGTDRSEQGIKDSRTKTALESLDKRT